MTPRTEPRTHRVEPWNLLNNSKKAGLNPLSMNWQHLLIWIWIATNLWMLSLLFFSFWTVVFKAFVLFLSTISFLHMCVQIICLFSSRSLDGENHMRRAIPEESQKGSFILIWIRIRYQSPRLWINTLMGWNSGVFRMGLLVFCMWEKCEILPGSGGILYFLKTLCVLHTMLYWHCFHQVVVSVSSLLGGPVVLLQLIVHGKRVAMWLLRLDHRISCTSV